MAVVSTNPIRFVDRKALYLVQIAGPILNTCRVTVYFVYIFSNFRYYGNKGSFESFFACTDKTANPENTPQRKNRLHVISVTSRVVANFVFIFVTVSTRVGLAKGK